MWGVCVCVSNIELITLGFGLNSHPESQHKTRNKRVLVGWLHYLLHLKDCKLTLRSYRTTITKSV